MGRPACIGETQCLVWERAAGLGRPGWSVKAPGLGLRWLGWFWKIGSGRPGWFGKTRGFGLGRRACFGKTLLILEDPVRLARPGWSAKNLGL
eukprot:5155187-Pyramimonas_sp.AAC.1